MKREILITPAFDRRHADPAKDYGIGSAQMHFWVSNHLGAISFSILTGWLLPHVDAEFIARKNIHCRSPLSAEVTAHSAKPFEPEQTGSEKCPIIKPICYTMWLSNGEQLLQMLLEKGF